MSTVLVVVLVVINSNSYLVISADAVPLPVALIADRAAMTE